MLRHEPGSRSVGAVCRSATLKFGCMMRFGDFAVGDRAMGAEIGSGL
jgi:hypothetical protein